MILRFDKRQNWPHELAVRRGTVLRFEGTVDGNVKTDFEVRDNGKVVASASGSSKWSMDWDTKSVAQADSVVEVFFHRQGEEQLQMARIDLQVLDRSPYQLQQTGVAPNGDPVFKLTGGPASAITGVTADLGDVQHPLVVQPDGSYRLPLSGLVPPHQHAVLEVELSTNALFPCGEIDLTIPERVFFADSKPLVVKRTEQTLGGAIRVGVRFAPHFAPTSADVDLKPGGIFVSGTGGGQILLTTDTLPEGVHQFSVVADGPDGARYLSEPRTLEVTSTPGYVKTRVLTEAAPELEDNAAAILSVVQRASDAELSVKTPDDEEAARRAWQNAADVVGSAIDNVHVQEPNGLIDVDTTGLVPALNHLNTNWMAYGRLYLQTTADTWKHLDLTDFDHFLATAELRAKSFADARTASSDAADALRNLVQSFGKQAGDLEVDPLRLGDAFAVDQKLRSAMRHRQAIADWLVGLGRQVSEALKANAAELDAREASVLNPDYPDRLPDGFQQASGMLLQSWAKAIHEEALTRRYADLRDRLLISVGGDQIQASQEDRKRLDDLENSIEASEKERDRLLSAGLQSVGDILTRYPVMAVTTGY